MPETTPILSVVIPVYNEEESLPVLYGELQGVLSAHGQPFEIIFIDDGSRDGSYAALQQLHQSDSRVRVIQFRRNFGQTAAFAAGFEYARGQFIVTLDADGQNDPADIPRLLAALEETDSDMVTGWRVNRREDWLRRLLSGTANRIISSSSGLVVHDRGCSLKVFRTDLAKDMRLYGQLHRFMPELASLIGARVTEVPVNDRPRQRGQSKYGALSRTPRVILDLITVFYLLTFFTSPMRLFGGIALFSGGTGFLISAALAGAKIWQGIIGGWEAFNAYEIGSRPLFLLGILLLIIGVQFLMMGLLGEMILRTYYEAQGKRIYTVRKILE